MKVVSIAGRVNNSGTLELLEPLPAEFRSMDVEVVICEPGDGKKFDGWDVLAVKSFFAEDDDEDSVYDTL